MVMSSQRPSLVVGVGASAGGLAAFKRLLHSLGDVRGVTLLLVQHLDPTHDSHLVDLLASHSALKVQEAADGIALEPDTIYVIRPDTALGVRDGRLQETAPTGRRGLRLPVDHLFRSIAQEYGARSAAIVLSGAGSDGAIGIREVRAMGGLTMAQVPDSCEHAAMAKSAINTGSVDLVTEIEEMGAALDRFIKMNGRFVAELSAEPTPERRTGLSDEQLLSLASILDAHADFDLRVYKSPTVSRRVTRRMGLAGFDDFDTYCEVLRTEGAERTKLCRDLLVNVTEFFRDEDAFADLNRLVVRPLVEQLEPGSTIRAWIPGCATGEEAYSIAIEFLEAIEASNKALELQIFATDIDSEALARARSAHYPIAIDQQVTESRLATYFKVIDGSIYQLRQRVRDCVSFAVHDLTRDPPFSRMHLVSCRNVLIYLTREVQRDVLDALHFALNEDGTLFLSTSETTGPRSELFSTLWQSSRLYKKVPGTTPMLRGSARSFRPSARESSRPSDPPASERPESGRIVGSDRTDLARRAVMRAALPPALVVAGDGQIAYSHGELSPYLRFPEDGTPHYDFTALLRPHMTTRARGALYRCRRTRQPVEVLATAEGAQGHDTRIRVYPAAGLGDDAVVITFEEASAAQAKAPVEGERSRDLQDSEQIVEQLERELSATQEDLRTTVEELETSNEELRSSNEESMSMNEELQSTNEELEATTAELRSLNEELTTVNAQLRDKVQQLERAHDDLTNFFSSTKIATVFLDEKLSIQRFTPAASELLSIESRDLGRHVGALALDLNRGLVEDAQQVLESLTGSECSIQSSTHRWYQRHVLPYRTESRRIEGVVVTYTDVTDERVATEALERRERQQSVVAQLGMQALREGGLQPFLDYVVRNVQQVLGSDLCKILELQPGGEVFLLRAGVGWRDGEVGERLVPSEVGSQAGFTLQSRSAVIVDDLHTESRFSAPALLTDHDVVSGLSCAIADGRHHYGVLAIHTTTIRHFTSQDADFLQAVATVVASALTSHQSRVRTQLDAAIAKAFTTGFSRDAALNKLVTRLAETMGAHAGLVWLRGGGTLSCAAQYLSMSIDDLDHGRLAQREHGERLLHLVKDREPRSFGDHNEQAFFVDLEVAAEFGLRTGLAIPVYFDEAEVLGVVVLYSRDRMVMANGFLRGLRNLGATIGDRLSRSRMQERLQGLASIASSSHDAIVTFDLEGRVTEWLSGAERLFGFTSAEALGQPIESFIPASQRDELWSTVEKIRRGEPTEPVETLRLRRDGEAVEVSVRSSPLAATDGTIAGISSIARDISRQKDAERRLLAADRQKDEFLAMLGHELRNPLAAITSATELMHLGTPQVVERCRAVLGRQTKHMTRLLDGLLDVSRIIRGKVEISTAEVDLVEICRNAVTDCCRRLQGRELDVDMVVPTDAVFVQGDLVRLTQVVDNLLTNAVKFTPDGGKVQLSVVSLNDFARLRVEDNGTGITEDLLPHVFDVFRQSEQKLDRERGGLGLGLSLVKGIVDLHGGSVTAMSNGEGQGATFDVQIPLARGPVSISQKAETPGHVITLPPQRILLVEDNAELAEMLTLLLRADGHEVAVAREGKQALAMALDGSPDIVLCDIGLPAGMSGFDVVRAMREREPLKGTPIIALSGYGRVEDKREAERAGFDMHLTKPVEPSRLRKLLALAASGQLARNSGDAP